jgi:cystathionine beta-lyase
MEGIRTMYNFDTLPDRRDTESLKWNVAAKDILPMWVADMDFRAPDAVTEALQERVNHGVFGYALHPDGLKETVVKWLSKRYDWDVSPEDILLVPGVVAGFNLAAHAVTRPGDGVVLQTPAYGPFFSVASNVNLIQQEMALTMASDSQFYVDYTKFEDCMSGRSRIFMLSNPQNPTGRVFRKHELEKIAEICLRNDIIICSDEIHSDFIFSGNKHIPIASLSPEIAASTITLLAPSKTFNIAGLKASVAVITNENLRTKFDGARKGLLGSVNLLGQHAMLAAYKYGEEWLDELLVYLEGNRDFLFKFVNKHLPGIQMAKPEGTYLGWLDCRDAGLGNTPSEFFKCESKVLLNEGEWFGENWKKFVRLNYGCPREMLVNALQRMKEALILKQG